MVCCAVECSQGQVPEEYHALGQELKYELGRLMRLRNCTSKLLKRVESRIAGDECHIAEL